MRIRKFFAKNRETEKKPTKKAEGIIQDTAHMEIHNTALTLRTLSESHPETVIFYHTNRKIIERITSRDIPIFLGARINVIESQNMLVQPFINGINIMDTETLKKIVEAGALNRLERVFLFSDDYKTARKITGWNLAEGPNSDQYGIHDSKTEDLARLEEARTQEKDKKETRVASVLNTKKGTATFFVQDVYTITGVGVVPVGIVKDGKLEVGMKLNINDTIMTVKTIERTRESIQEAEEGDRVGFSISGADFELAKALLGSANRTEITFSEDGSIVNRIRLCPWGEGKKWELVRSPDGKYTSIKPLDAKEVDDSSK